MGRLIRIQRAVTEEPKKMEEQDIPPLSAAELNMYMQAAIEAVKLFVRNDVRGGGSSYAACLDAAHAAMKELYRIENLAKRARAEFKNVGYEPLYAMFPSMDKELTEFIHNRYLECIRRQKAVQVQKVTAKGILEPGLQSSGLKFRVAYQRYRAKVEILLDCDNSFCVYIPYKSLYEVNYLDGILDTVNLLNGMIAEYGSSFEVSKRYKL